MTVERSSGAPRLIEWTGERCVPWAPDVQVVYEHYHRYLWASALVDGRRVLDLASGEGFGSAILAGRAAAVTGIDIDQATIDHSQLNYVAENLEFRIGSAVDLSELPEDGYDVVVAFELIEHLAEQDRMLAEIDRVLAPGGIVLMSTPDRRMYSDAAGQDNPFHVKELAQDEFRSLLGQHFEHVALWGQRTTEGSRIGAIDHGAADTALPFFIERAGEEWRVGGEPAPLYVLAVASHGALPAVAAESNLSDPGIEMFRTLEGRAAREVGEVQRELSVSEEALSASEEARTLARAALRTVEEQLEATRREAERARRAEEAVRADRDQVASRLARIEASVTWAAFQRARGRLYGTIGEDSAAGRALQASLRGAKRRFGNKAGSGPAREGRGSFVAGGPIEFPRCDRPVASLVIPVYSQADLTEACLQSILDNTEGLDYEVILVDDAADQPSKDLFERVANARIVVNEENLGYLHSMNKGCGLARGEYVVLLNNDVEVQPGWLSALVERAESADDVGAVGPMLLYPDGSLQEAGSIVFDDASGWNFGKHDDPSRPAYNFAREVDYASAACLLVRTSLFREIGGFDERFAPAYYEDTDLCFAVREHGHRVMYEPRSRVVHVEGATSGTDETAGVKRHQVDNQPKFREKWATQLAEQYPPDEENVLAASDRNRGPTVLVIDHRIPMPDRDSGSLRMVELLRGLRDLGCRVVFLPDSAGPPGPYTRRLEADGIEVLDGQVDLRIELGRLSSRLRLVILSRPYVAGRYVHIVREHAPNAHLAYDTVDLHFAREKGRAQVSGREGLQSVAASMREIELGLVRASDSTLVVSDDERDTVLAEVPDATVHVVPNANELSGRDTSAARRSGLLFVGGFEHLPNVDAACFLVDSVMPIVWRELPDVELTIVGPAAPPEVYALEGPNVTVTGWVEDLAPYLASTRLSVAPLRYGAGMKGKVTQSLAQGLPVVTTSIGAEGLHATSGEHMLIADDADAFAREVIRAYRDDELWQTLARNGRTLIEAHASPAVMRERLRGLLDSID